MRGKTTAIVPPEDELPEPARSILKREAGGHVLTPEEQEVLEQAVALHRPGAVVAGGVPGFLSPDAMMVFTSWESFQRQAAGPCAAVARIERPPGGREAAVGSGFLVDPMLVATNRHVAVRLPDGLGLVRFQVEADGPEPEAVDVADVIVPDDAELDLALLRLSEPAAAAMLPLDVATAQARQRVVLLGYPFPDDAQRGEGRAVFPRAEGGVLHACPGRVMEVHRSGEIWHDCSALGGNSGSPLLDLDSRSVIGVHYQGSYKARNKAIPASRLAAFIETVSA